MPLRVTRALVLLATLSGPLEAWASEPVRTLDLHTLFSSAPADQAMRRNAYDTLVAAACLQGLANRSGPNLYLFYVTSEVDGSIDTDRLWFGRLSDPNIGGGILDGRSVIALPDLNAAIDAYAGLIRGLVVWDENVPATVNAAFTAAGADDLIAVRWDAAPNSLFARLMARGFPVRVWLVNPNGSSRFLDRQGTALVPDLNRQTSQSAKADAYVWALEKYLKVPGKLDGRELGYMLDARWIRNPNDYSGAARATSQLQITNRDWLVAKRGLPFDLSPWTDVAATDDPLQPVGTDPGVLREIVSAARSMAGTDVVTIRGFFAWQFKYTTLEGLPAGHEPVLGEWNSVKLVSPYAAGLDADAPGVATMANASFFAHVPLSETPEPQPRPTPEDLVGHGFLSGLASNGGFEDLEQAWAVHLTNHVIYTDDATTGPRSHGGLRFLECNTRAVGDDTQDNLYRDGRGLAPGETAVLRAFVRAPLGRVDGELVIWALGGTMENAVTRFSAGPSWTEVRVSITAARAGHTSTRGQLYLRTANANLDIDDVAFYAGDPASSAVEPATYVLWFVGDYDAAAWIYEFTPTTWDRPGRGIVPFAWDFSGHVASRFPPFFRHALLTRTPRDFFVGADSGPGYGNPSQMDANARAIWAAGGVKDARLLDTSIGWILNPLDPLDAAHLSAVTPFYGDGVLLMSAGGVSGGSIIDHAPIVRLDNLGGDTVPSATSFIVSATPNAPILRPSFFSFRAVLWRNNDLVAVTRNLVADHGDRRYRFVDPFTFFELERKDLGGDNRHRASFRSVALPAMVAPGAPIHVSMSVRNDGWERWRAQGANPYRIGLHLASRPPAPRTLPNEPGAYPTRIALAADLAPGAEAAISTTLTAPASPGTYTLQVDVVEEGVTWFETAGDIPLQVTVRVGNAPSPDAGPGADAVPRIDAASALDGGTDAAPGALDAEEPGSDASGLDAAVADRGREDGASSRGAAEQEVTTPGQGCACSARPASSRAPSAPAGSLVVLISGIGFAVIRRRRSRTAAPPSPGSRRAAPARAP